MQTGDAKLHTPAVDETPPRRKSFGNGYRFLLMPTIRQTFEIAKLLDWLLTLIPTLLATGKNNGHRG
jgi:hypothetical protein